MCEQARSEACVNRPVLRHARTGPFWKAHILKFLRQQTASRSVTLVQCAQGCRMNVHTLASGQTRSGVVNTWPKTGVDALHRRRVKMLPRYRYHFFVISRPILPTKNTSNYPDHIEGVVNISPRQCPPTVRQLSDSPTVPTVPQQQSSNAAIGLFC